MTQMGLVAIAGTLMGVLPLVLGAFYAIAPTEARLALMRPLSLATIFAAVSASVLGLLNVLRGLTLRGGDGSLAELSRMSAAGMAESLVPLFVGFGCLTVAWLCVAVGLWRRP